MLHYFSSARYIVNKTRSSLDQNTVNMIVCVSVGLVTGAADIEVPIFNRYQ